jgi:hypothetical protein
MKTVLCYGDSITCVAADHVDTAIRRPRPSVMGIVERFRQDVVGRVRRNLFEAAVTQMGYAGAVRGPRDWIHATTMPITTTPIVSKMICFTTTAAGHGSIT